MAQKEPVIVKQIDAVQFKIEPEGRLTINSKMLPEIKEWQTGETYRLKSIEMVQKSSRQIEDGVIESEFEVRGVENG